MNNFINISLTVAMAIIFIAALLDIISILNIKTKYVWLTSRKTEKPWLLNFDIVMGTKQLPILAGKGEEIHIDMSPEQDAKEENVVKHVMYKNGFSFEFLDFRLRISMGNNDDKLTNLAQSIS